MGLALVTTISGSGPDGCKKLVGNSVSLSSGFLDLCTDGVIITKKSAEEGNGAERSRLYSAWLDLMSVAAGGSVGGRGG